MEALSFIPWLYKNSPRLMYWACRFTQANYEKEMELLKTLCDPQKISLDIGAKVGMFTYRLLPYSKAVWAFEPIPELAALLQKNFSPRVQVEAIALSDHSGEAVLRTPFNKQGFPKFGRSSLEADNSLQFKGLKRIVAQTVKVRCLDEYDLKNVGFIKIDVEGHELAVLCGALQTLKKERPTLMVEALENIKPSAVSQLTQFLEKLDYEGCFLDGGRFHPIKNLDPARNNEAEIKNFIFFPSPGQFRSLGIPTNP